jgi:putative pyruvate formate lyase activating enzyme
MDFSELFSCKICPRNCGVNRYETSGFCGAGADLKVNLCTLHHGEEPCLSGTRGSGTIFFSWCNLHCAYCQNHNISKLGWGKEIGVTELAAQMLILQEHGAHNINLVTPTHYSLHIAAAIKIAKKQGLLIPVVWNSSAYESVKTLQSLAGLVDI